MAVDVVVGLQRGDEGKGRFVDMLAADHDIVARFNGGDNAGHTVQLPDERILKLHMVPSGIAHEHTVNVIGRGTFVNPVNLSKEIESIEAQDFEVSPRNLKICGGAQLILPHHIFDDAIREAGADRQGSTKSGIAQVASYRALRKGMRTDTINNEPERLLDIVVGGLRAQREARLEVGLEDIDEEEVAQDYMNKARRIGAFITDTTFYLNQQLAEGKSILAEGAQAFLLDVDHGMAPYTTSSSTTSGGVSPGLGIPPTAVDRVVGVAKATQSHVGGGPFVTEIHDQELLTQLRGDMTSVDAEVGVTTGRVRRLGHLDLPQLRRANMINGTHEMGLTKLDWVSRYGDEIPVCVAYSRKGKELKISPDSARKLEESTPEYAYLPGWQEDISHVREFDALPDNAKNYVKFIEDETGVPITMIGVGPSREQVIVRQTIL